MMTVQYAAGYQVPLPAGHRFPMGKYAATYELLVRGGLLSAEQVREPGQADWATLRLVHTPEYLNDLAHGTLTSAAVRRLGFPWSDALLRRSRLSVQGTLDAARAALAEGIAANLAGGTHHAFPGHGEGFCVLNDVAVAIRALQVEGAIRQAAVIDLDVHQGNGAAAIFEADSSVFTLSVHGEKNWPLAKQRSSLDIGLPDGSGDSEYLAVLPGALDAALAGRPEIAFFLAGVDVAAGDRLGRLALSPAGILARERLVLSQTRAAGVPVVIVMAGGYGPSVEQTAALHTLVYQAAAEIYK